MRVLLIEDEPTTAKSIEMMLTTEGFNVYTTDLGEEGLDLGKLYDYDIILLDLNLPDMHGYDVLKKLRLSKVQTPVLILSGIAEMDSKVRSFGFGADDYVTKPFEPRELVARIRTILRRTSNESAAAQSGGSGRELLQFGTWVMNVGARALDDAKTGVSAGLTSMEFDLLKALVEHPKTVLSRDQLLDFVRGQDFVVGDRAIDVHIMRLRKKIEPEKSEPRYIKTVHGIGYYFVDDVVRFNETANPAKPA